MIIAAVSPRRFDLLRPLDYAVREIRPEYDVILPSMLLSHKAPEVLSRKKMEQAIQYHKDEDAIITADTVVLLEGELIQKPDSEEEAREHLRRLSGSKHEVIT